MRRRVVVTGLGVVTALGLEVKDNWERLLAGTSGIRKVTLPGAERSPVQAAGEVGEADWLRIRQEFPAEAETEGERRTLFALWAAKQALRDGGVLDGSGDRDRFAVLVAAGLGINRLEDIQRWLNPDKGFDALRFGREYREVHRESLMRNNSHRPAALIGDKFDLRALNATVTSACAAATQAIGIGSRTIQRGDADLVIAGGADSMINPIGLVFFALLGAAATSQDAPALVCRPFDRKRSGLVMGEGAGMVVLEEESHAKRRGVRIYGEVAGYGSSIDAYQVTAPHPMGRGAEQSMRAALDDAGLGVHEIDYINAHGTSTKLNDTMETLAIKNVFKEYAGRIAVSSSKSMIGHLLAAAGGPEFVYTVLSVYTDEVHPTINLSTRDPRCDLHYVANRKVSKKVRAALSNSFGFGGQNGSIIVKKYQGEKPWSSS